VILAHRFSRFSLEAHQTKLVVSDSRRLEFWRLGRLNCSLGFQFRLLSGTSLVLKCGPLGIHIRFELCREAFSAQVQCIRDSPLGCF
jgi:hypothetical protein